MKCVLLATLLIGCDAMEIREMRKDDYVRFTRSQKSDNFLQSIEMFSRYERIKREAYLFGGFVDGEVQVACLVVCVRDIRGLKIFNIARGPILDYDAKNCLGVLGKFLDGLSSILRKKKGIILQISPNVFRFVDIDKDGKPICGDWWEKNALDVQLMEKRFRYLGEYGQIKWSYVKDLDVKEGEVLKSFRYGHRSSIKIASDRYGVQTRFLDVKDVGVLKDITESTGERCGFRDPDIEYYCSMKEAFGNKVYFAVAEKKVGKNKVPIAAGMFLEYGESMTYLFGGSDVRYKKYCGPCFLQWEMIKKALKNGDKTYDFYGTHPFSDAKDFGVYKFKNGFNGKIIEYVGTYARSLNIVGRLYLKRIKTLEYRDVS